MAHNIHRDNFYSFRSVPWHRIQKAGISRDEEMTAIDLADLIELPIVTEYPVYAQTQAGVFTKILGRKAVYGATEGEVLENKPGEVFCVVDDGYQVIPHQEFLSLVDEATGREPVETLGLLGNGEIVFLTYRMDRFDVKGDEIEPFMLLVSPLNGNEAMRGGLTSVRVVCQNTLDYAEARRLSHTLHVVHRSRDSIREELQAWIMEMTGRADAERSMMQEVYTALANLAVTDHDMDRCTKLLWPVLQLVTLPAGTKSHIVERIRATGEANERHRIQACALFQGSLTHTTATRGTAWGMLNAVSEYVDHASSQNDRDSASAFVGSGARIKQAAFMHCKNLLTV